MEHRITTLKDMLDKYKIMVDQKSGIIEKLNKELESYQECLQKMIGDSLNDDIFDDDDDKNKNGKGDGIDESKSVNKDIVNDHFFISCFIANSLDAQLHVLAFGRN